MKFLSSYAAVELPTSKLAVRTASVVIVSPVAGVIVIVGADE